MKEPEHIITFLRRAKKFSKLNGITSTLKVDNENTVDDVFEPAETTGGLIAEIDNSVGEIIDKLEAYYNKTNNHKLLKQLEKVRKE